MPTIDLNKTTLRDEVRKYLRSQRGNYQRVIDATGVSRRWITYVASDFPYNPRSQQCEAVLRFAEDQRKRQKRRKDS